MSFTALGKGGTPGTPYTSGSPVTYQDFELIRGDFDNHEARILAVEADLTAGFVAHKVEDTHGGYWQRGVVEEEITLNTGGATTDSSANLLPAGAIIEAVCARVTTTITTATNWAVGDATTSARFSSANATLTAGTTSVGLNHQKGGVSTDAAGPTQAAAAKVRITTTGSNPGAGKIRVSVFYSLFVAPTS